MISHKNLNLLLTYAPIQVKQNNLNGFVYKW